jgi:hypothetical protein
MKTQITNLDIKIGNREIHLTMEEAKSLHSELSVLFQQTLSPVFIPQQPIFIDRSTWPQWPNRWDITCHAGESCGAGEPKQFGTLSMSVG